MTNHKYLKYLSYFEHDKLQLYYLKWKELSIILNGKNFQHKKP
jgi:hypothetical protein